MRRRLWFAIVSVTVGLGMLLAAGFASPAESGTQGATKAEGRGGTLRIDSRSDFDFIDPSLAYFVHTWQIMGAVGAHLLRFPDAEGAAGSRLIPEVAAGFPQVSRDGRTYTFTLKRTYRFSNGKPVTAANFAFAINRGLNPAQQSPAGPFVNDIVGAPAVQEGKARTASGVRVLSPYRLQIRLSRPAPDILVVRFPELIYSPHFIFNS